MKCINLIVFKEQLRCTAELPWPSGYALRLSLKRSRVLIPVKVIGGRQEGHPVQKMLTATAKSQLTIGHRPSPVKKTGCVT